MFIAYRAPGSWPASSAVRSVTSATVPWGRLPGRPRARLRVQFGPLQTSTGGAMARTLSVSPQQPGAYRTIQDALEMATDDAVISIAPGTYVESVRLERQRISLVSSGDPGSVIIDAQTIGLPVVTGRGADITLQGLVLKAGDTPAVNVGVSVAHQSAPTIRNSWIHDTQGVGIAVGRGCKGHIEGCTFESTAMPAIQVDEGASPTVVEAPAGAAKGFGRPLDKAIQQDP